MLSAKCHKFIVFDISVRLRFHKSTDKCRITQGLTYKASVKAATEGAISLARSRQVVDQSVDKHKKKTPQSLRGLKIVSEWCHQESNRGHKDFQSFALPTELWHRKANSTQLFLFCGCKGS